MCAMIETIINKHFTEFNAPLSTPTTGYLCYAQDTLATLSMENEEKVAVNEGGEERERAKKERRFHITHNHCQIYHLFTH